MLKVELRGFANVLFQATKGFTIITEVSDHSETALDNLGCIAFIINLAQPNPLTEFFASRNLHQANAML